MPGNPIVYNVMFWLCSYVLLIIKMLMLVTVLVSAAVVCALLHLAIAIVPGRARGDNERKSAVLEY